MNELSQQAAGQFDHAGYFRAQNLRYDLRKPCDDCPFAKSSTFHQGVATSLPTYLESIDRGEFAHTCHKTDNRPECDGPRNHDGPVQHCAGALLMLLRSDELGSTEKDGCPGYWMQRGLTFALDNQLISDEDLRDLIQRAKTADVFTVDELKAFYLQELEQLLACEENSTDLTIRKASP